MSIVKSEHNKGRTLEMIKMMMIIIPTKIVLRWWSKGETCCWS